MGLYMVCASVSLSVDAMLFLKFSDVVVCDVFEADDCVWQAASLVALSGVLDSAPNL